MTRTHTHTHTHMNISMNQIYCSYIHTDVHMYKTIYYFSNCVPIRLVLSDLSVTLVVSHKHVHRLTVTLCLQFYPCQLFWPT